jgi:glycosyltransferase involved in cell wall biosynthesis
MAAPIKQQLNLPVVCSLQDEEVWIDSLQGEWSKLAWEAIETNTSYVDAFITTSNYYKSIATKKVPSLNPTVIYPGINIKKYYKASLPDNPTIGFFYRMNDLDGLDTLAKAFVMLKQRGNIPNLKLRLGGGNTGSDNKFLTGVRNILSPYMDDVIIEQEYSPMAHHRFYKEVSIVSVPLQFDEGVGLYICEAYAAGRPVVEPHRGSFPEIVGEGGLLYSDESAKGLADALEQMLTSQSLYESKRQAACALAQERYSDKECATKLIDVYTRIMN